MLFVVWKYSRNILEIKKFHTVEKVPFFQWSGPVCVPLVCIALLTASACERRVLYTLATIDTSSDWGTYASPWKRFMSNITFHSVCLMNSGILLSQRSLYWQQFLVEKYNVSTQGWCGYAECRKECVGVSSVCLSSETFVSEGQKTGRTSSRLTHLVSF